MKNFTLAKRISEFQKKEIIQCFIQRNSIEEIAKRFKFAKLTISRNLKKSLGEDRYKEIIKEIKQGLDSDDLNFSNNKNTEESDFNSQSEENISLQSEFVEIKPMPDIFEESQKDISSIPIISMEFPKIVYLIISNKFELQPKFLKDYPEWQFLPSDDLERKTIEIFDNSKSAKLSCTKDQKVIKVPNTNVFRIVAPILIMRGISRIISQNSLIAL